MPKPHGFSYERHNDHSVSITHRGRAAATLRGPRADKFLAEVESGDAQLVMARWTGAYKFGNERMAKNHPRNRR
uniref:Hydrophilic protein n=1 Tax=Streptomyces sp. NBC_00049 TaxID=2903617 RepID=A0AAU2JLF4_9ACTN